MPLRLLPPRGPRKRTSCRASDSERPEPAEMVAIASQGMDAADHGLEVLNRPGTHPLDDDCATVALLTTTEGRVLAPKEPDVHAAHGMTHKHVRAREPRALQQHVKPATPRPMLALSPLEDGPPRCAYRHSGPGPWAGHSCLKRQRGGSSKANEALRFIHRSSEQSARSSPRCARACIKVEWYGGASPKDGYALQRGRRGFCGYPGAILYHHANRGRGGVVGVRGPRLRWPTGATRGSSVLQCTVDRRW